MVRGPKRKAPTWQHAGGITAIAVWIVGSLIVTGFMKLLRYAWRCRRDRHAVTA